MRIGTFIRRTLGLGIVVGLAAGAYVGWWLYEYRAKVLDEIADRLDNMESFRPLDSVLVYDRHQEQIDSFHVERRIWVDLDTLPPHVPEAFLAAEDRRFWEHRGVDPQGIARAVWENYRHGRISQGASTLTQQLAKNLFVGKERSYERKLREAIVAVALEQKLGKLGVLELYLNFVYLGEGNHGLEAAARDYYGISATDLSPAQAATLASVVPAPSHLNPRESPREAETRRNRVLAAMVQTDKLSEEDAALAREADIIGVPVAPEDASKGQGDAYRTEVRRELRRLFGNKIPFTVGMRVFTPYDPAVQVVAEAAVRSATEGVQKQTGPWAIVEHLEPEARTAFLEAAKGLSKAEDGSLLAPAAGDCGRALVRSAPSGLQMGPHKLTLARRELSRRVRHRDMLDEPSASYASQVQTGDVVRICLDDEGVVRIDDSLWVQGAAAVIDNRTGEVTALVGGNDVELEGFVRATQALRQPGSTFKPFVYAAALEHGYSQLSTVVDEPITLEAGTGEPWTPKNFKDTFLGPVTLRRAIAASLNSISVKLIDDVGAHQVAATARSMGVRSPLDEVLALALGASDVTVMDQAVGFATMARGGVHRAPVLLRSIHDRHDDLLGTAGGLVRAPDGTVLAELPGKPTQVLDSGVAFELRDMLTSVVQRGSGSRVRSDTQARAGKTGTTNLSTDLWFVGFTTDHTVAVWIGSDERGSLGHKLTGGRVAAPVWRTIVDSLGDHPHDDAFNLPPSGMMVQTGAGWIGVRRALATAEAVYYLPPFGDRPLPLYPGQKVPFGKAPPPPPPPPEEDEDGADDAEDGKVDSSP